MQKELRMPSKSWIERELVTASKEVSNWDQWKRESMRNEVVREAKETTADSYNQEYGQKIKVQGS